MNAQDFPLWMSSIQQRTEQALATLLPDAALAPQTLHTAMRYAVLGGGKRVRALLAHAAGELVSASAANLDAAACAVELIHAYSLVHDDMPCMDNDVLRRGKPTVHVEFDEPTALLTGDALQTLAFQALSNPSLTADPARQLKMVTLLAQASGSRGMAGGQAIDLSSVGKALSREDLEFMHIHKTGALILASVRIGALCGDDCAPDTLNQLDHYGKLIGLLFQVVDDILDAESDTATLGKTAGKDVDDDKPTYVSMLGMTEARALADALLTDALDAIAPLEERGQRLAELATFIVHRKF